MSSQVTEEQIQSFCAITGAAADRARFYIEAANGDIDARICLF